MNNVTEDDFYTNTLIQDAVFRSLEIIGGVVKQIPSEIKVEYEKIHVN